MENIVFNKCQTPLEDLHLDHYPNEVVEQFWDYLNNVPFIKWMVSPDRPYVHELPRDDQGRVIIDVTHPPILENSDFFRSTAKVWEETGSYTKLRPNRNPNSDFGRWLREERRRGWEGYTDPSTGMWVTGDYYWMLNYCPMHLIEKRKDGFEIRVVKPPKFWDGQFLVSHYFLQARLHKHQAAELASRGKGKTTLGAAMLAKRFIIGETAENQTDVQCLCTAADKTKLIGTNQILSVFKDDIDFAAKNTQFASHRLKSSTQELTWKMGYKMSGSDVEYGSKNEVSGIISGVNQDKLNGSRGVLYLIEEAGIFKDLLNMYNLIRPSVEQGSSVFGEIIGYGCVCAGTKVLDGNGNLRDIEDIQLGDKLLGYDGNKASTEDITYIQGEAYKECVRITTSKGRQIECSIDHPLMAVNNVNCRSVYKSCSFYRAKELKAGMNLLIPRQIGRFGNIHEKDAFLLGALFGDGCYSNQSCVTLSICTEEEYEYYNSHYDIGISKLSKSNNVYAQIYFRNLHPLLKKYMMDRQSFDKKKLPYNINSWNKESLCEFLSGYFNADGNIQIVHKKYRAIKLSCKYKNTLVKVQYLLHKLGIVSHILQENKSGRVLHSNVNKKSYNMPVSIIFVLYINSAEDVMCFRENMHLIIKEKQERLNSYIPPKKSEGYYKTLKFKLKDNGKGKYFVGKELHELKGVTIKSIEYIGKKRIYNLTANTTHTYLTNGFISSNTAGDEQSDFTAFAEMIYSPDGYNMEPLDNVYDKEGQGRKKITVFYPAYMNYDNTCIDKDGNSDVTKALLMLLYDRYKVKYGSTDINTITKRISQYPITPQEAIVRSQGNVFPVTELNERLNQIDNNPSEYDDVYIGDLVFNNKTKEVEFKNSVDLPIRDYPLKKGTNPKGALQIYEMPQKNREGKVATGRYILSLDPYYNDQADSVSLGSIFVLDLWTDRIVAAYIGRPTFADDLYELLRKLCLFYNGKCLYENNAKGCFAYFSKYNSLYLLAETPEYLRDKQLIKTAGFGNTAYGVRATPPIINYGFTLIRDWLLKPITKIEKDTDGNDVETTIPNLYSIRDRELLKELILWNPNGNYDSVMSMVQLMLYREEKMILFQGDVTKQESTSSGMENDDYWSKNYPGKISDRVSTLYRQD